VPYGIARVIQNGTFSLEGDTIELFGGSNRYAWQAEDGDINATLAFSVSEYPNWLFQLFGGKAPTQNAPETSGNIATPENINGVSMFDSVLGVASIAVSTAANLKFTKYTLEATAVDGFKLYAGSDVDFGRGAPTGFFDDSLLIAEFSSVGSSGVLTLTTLGLEITMGSAIDMVAGDTAIFEVRPVNELNRVVKIGGIADEYPEFGAILYAQKAGSNAVVEIDVFKLKAIGLTLGAERKAFAQQEYSAKATYDSVRDGICSFREVGDTL